MSGTAQEQRATPEQRARILHSGRQPTVAGFERRERSSAPERPRADDNTLLVRFNRGTSADEWRDVAADAGGRTVSYVEELSVGVIETNGGSRAEVSARLKDDPRVDGVELNLIRYASGDPNDDHFFAQGSLFSSRLPAAWDVTHGIATIDIAILDTGVDLDHPDLAPRIVAGADIVNNDSRADDDEGHGTFVAGVAAADSDNGRGIAGSAWDARIMPVKVLDSGASGTDGDIAEGIVWAVKAGAEIINLSLGAPGSTQTFEDAISFAVARGVVVVAAMGNGATDEPSFPAAYDEVVAVGASDIHGDVVGFSNRGSHIDVVAQGWDVVSTWMDAGAADSYGIGAGTSFAAPLVSGIAALILARNTTLTPAQVENRLRTTAIDRGPGGIDPHYGWGLVDAYGAVGGRTAAPPPAAKRDGAEPDDTTARARTITSDQTATISPEGDVDWYAFSAPAAGTITVTVTPPADGQGGVALDAVVSAASATDEAMGTFNDAGAGQTEVAKILVPAAGTYRFSVSNAASSRSPGPISAPRSYSVAAVHAPGAASGEPGDKLWVSDVSPAPFVAAVEPSARPVVSFAREVTATSASSGSNVRLIDAKTNSTVTATRSYDSTDRQVTITPSAALVRGRTYVVAISGLADDAGSMSETFTSRFTVDPGAQPVDLTADFNRDGFEDAVITAPGEDLGSNVDAGVVHILYGGPTGPSGTGSQMWSQDSSGIAGAAESRDRFGNAVSTGDLNNDGFDDLVIGVSGEDIGSARDAGLVHVLFGSASKLRSTGAQYWTQDSRGVPGGVESSDRFGAALAIGDFDNASGDDLAIGAPGEGIGNQGGAGLVHILRGASGGLVTAGTQAWTQDSAGIEFFAEAGDRFGATLAAGDFHGDTHDDLAIGAPSDNVVDADEGSVTLMRGTIVGMRPAGIVADWLIDSQTPQSGDLYGLGITIADVGGFGTTDGYADLVVGVPGQTLGTTSKAGRVDVVFGDHTGPWFAVQSIDQSSFDMGSRTANTIFGSVMQARTFGANAVLAVGVQYDEVSGITDAGSVHVYSSGTPLDGGYFGLGGVRVLTQDAEGVPDAAEENDRFGADVVLGDVDGDDLADLVVGAPLESIGSRGGAGVVFAIRSVSSDAPVAALFSQDTAGVAGGTETNDYFGVSVG